MKNEDLHIDKEIREKLEGFSAEPPAHLWNNIQGQMGSIRRKKRMAIIGWTSAAAVVVFAFIAGWMLNNESGEVMPEVVEQQQEINNQSQQEPLNLDENQNIAANQATEEEQTKTFETTNEPVILEASKTTFIAENQKVAVESREESTELLRNPEEYDLIKTRSVVFVKPQNEKLAAFKEPKTIYEVELSGDDQAMIAANLERKDQVSEEEHGWIIGAHISPGYASHSSSYSRTYSQNMNRAMEGGVSNTGGGFSIQYKSGKRLRIESGVYYAQNSQSVGASNRLLDFDPGYNMADGMVSEAASPGFANVVQVSRTGITMNSTAGVVKMRNTPQGAQINAITDASKDVYSTTLVAEGEFSQVFDLLEIPLYLRYKVLDKKFGIDVLGGLNAGLVVGNNAYIENNSGKQNIGTTEDISTMNVSGTVGVGVNYALGRHVSLAMEPRFNYFLNSINTSPDVDYKPYRFGVFTGIYFAF